MVVPSGSVGWLVAGLPTLPFAVVFLIPVVLGQGGVVAAGAAAGAAAATVVRPLYWRRFRRRNRVEVDQDMLRVIRGGAPTVIAVGDIAELGWVYGSKAAVQLLSATSWEATVTVTTVLGETISTPLLIATLRGQRRGLTALAHALPSRMWAVSWVEAHSPAAPIAWDPSREPVPPSGVRWFAHLTGRA